MRAISTTEMFPTESVISNNTDESVAEAVVRETDEGALGARSRADSRHGGSERSRNHWLRALGILLCLEVGIFLFLAPWSPLWTENRLLGYYPALRSFYMDPFVRGGISGLGLLNLWFAFRGIWEFRRPGAGLE